MTDWLTITDSQVDPDAPITSGLGYAWRDNPIAISEGSDGAPVLSSAWHPYNMVYVGDGNDGKFYDFAVHGAVANFTTPTYADGYDYFVRLVGLSPAGGTNVAFQVGGVSIAAATNSASTLTGFLEILAPTLLNFPKIGRLHTRETSGSTAIAPSSTAQAGVGNPFVGQMIFANMGTALTSTTFQWSGQNNDAGQAYLYRRRNFMFG